MALLLTSIGLGVALVGMAGLRAAIWVAEYNNVWCPPGGGPDFITRSTCVALAEPVTAGQLYRVSVTVKERWVDRTIDTNPGGFGPSTMSFVGNLLSPLRRSMSGQWFQPMLKIVPKDGIFAMVALEMQRADTRDPVYSGQFTAPKDGRVYFFVNDVLLPRWAPYAERFYDNNLGSATVAIEKVVALDAAR